MSEQVTETPDAKQDKIADPRLFMMLYEATAGAKTGLRLGARHPIMVFMVASEIKFARAKARKGLDATGWSGLLLRKSADITGQKVFDDKALNAAARKAIEKGASFLVYKDEIKGQE